MSPAVANLPSAAGACDGEFRLVWRDVRVPQDVRGEIARVAYLECRELNRPLCYDGSETDEHPRLLVALRHERAVGFVMVADGDVCWRLRWRRNGVDAISRDRELTQNPHVGRVWIAAGHRGRGLATAMIRHAAEQLAVAPSDFVWTIPLTPGRERLVRSLCPDIWFADGNWDDLFTILGENRPVGRAR